MIKTLDKYIIKKYLKTFFFTVLIFTLIAVIIDFSERVEDFINEPCTLTEIIFHYYVNFILYINSLLWPLFALIAVIFFTSRMAYDSEIISILNAGVSFRRLLVPYYFAAGTIALLHLLGNHFFVPLGNKVRLDFEHQYIWQNNDKGKTNDVHMFIGPDTKAYIRFYKKRDSIARNIRIERFDGDELVYLLKAESAHWMGPPNNWSLKNYEIRTFNGMQETIRRGKGQTLDTTLNFYPDDFVRYLHHKEMMSSPKLLQFIEMEKSRGVGNTKQYAIEFQRRTADPFTILILTLIGTSVAARKVRGGMGLHLAIGMGLGALFIFLSRFSVTFATNDDLPPFLGVWIPNILFSAVALILMFKAQK